MAGRSLHRLFELGAVGALSDAQLLELFRSRRGEEAAEAAFEELVNRHGPMVLRVCRSLLRDEHDAEDAFQAVFLVLAGRAGSIRRGGSVASWLFGVAHRVSGRLRRGAARRRRLDHLIAERAAEGLVPNDDAPDREALHDEIDALPDRLRAPIVLCYLQGLTYAAAARELGVSEVAVRGRLERARLRLRHRLTGRGVANPAGLLVAGAAVQTQAAVPASLIHSTVRIALGFAAGRTAAALARGVLNAMLLNEVKVATVFLCVGLAGGLWAWHASAGAADPVGRADPGPVARIPAPASKPEADRPAGPYRLVGSVRVEGTGEPVPGGRLMLLLGDGTASNDPDRTRTIISDREGRLLADLPAGQARAWSLLAPVGYWAPGNMKAQETFVLSPTEPIHSKDYVVRRGTVWPFRLVDAGGKPAVAFVQTSGSGALFRAEAEDDGRADLTLPTESSKMMAAATRGRMRSVGFSAMPVVIPMEWAAGFRPGAVKAIEKVEGGHRLTDDTGRTATIGEAPREIPDGAGGSTKIGETGQVEPAIVDGKLAIRVVFSDAGRASLGRLAGRVVDQDGRPVWGVRVAPAFHIHEGRRGGGVFPDDAEHEAITGRDGRFLLRAIPREDVSGKPSILTLVVRKDGFASLETPEFPFKPGPGDSPQVIDPIRIEPGVSLSGTVVDPEGRPVEGAWVTPSGGFALRSQFTRTDVAGKFTVHNLPRGLIELGFEYGPSQALGKYLADGVDDGVKVQLRPVAEVRARPAAAAAPDPPAIGRPAPALQVVGWTDGKPRSLVDYRGRVVFLDFWGTWCGPCVNGLPSLERLKQKYEPRGVVFLSIHTPGMEIGRIRRFLDLKKATIVSALDEGRGKEDEPRNGMTADRYGVRGYPTFVMIDRRGNVAFHSGIGTKEGVAAMKALGKEMGLDESTMTEADFYRLWEAFFGREIERVLDRP